MRWGNKGDLKNPNFSTLYRIGKFRSTAQAYFQNTQFSIFIINWEKLRSSAKVTFKITRSFCELETTWKNSLRPTLGNPNFASMDE